MSFTFTKLLESDGSWDAFEADWRSQCDFYNEDFDTFASDTFGVVKDLVAAANDKAGLYVLKDGDIHVAMCQLNCAMIPNYKGQVLRARFITLCPNYDLGEIEVGVYSSLMVELLYHILRVSELDPTMASQHVKLHLRSPADQPFFKAFGRGMDEHPLFESVRTVGQWLYISKTT